MFYQIFLQLCTEIGKKPNNVTKALGLSTASATDWKKGRIPRDATLQKLANYFGVSINYLLGKEPMSPRAESLEALRSESVAQYPPTPAILAVSQPTHSLIYDEEDNTANAPSSVEGNACRGQAEEDDLLSLFRSFNRSQKLHILEYCHFVAQKNRK